MKKIIVFLTMLMVVMVCNAQEKKDVTKFMGIPVDGTKSEMIHKLKAKGFKYDVKHDCLKGEFNGYEVEIRVVTNKNKVYRIVVLNAIGVDESSIKNRFNTLCHQFEQNERYVPAILVGKYEIDEDEDISYEMLIHNKIYEADFYQVDFDSVKLSKYIIERLNDMYTSEELSNLTENEKEREKIVMKLCLQYVSKKSVWFRIRNDYGKYYIAIYYDNEYNAPNGDDL